MPRLCSTCHIINRRECKVKSRLKNTTGGDFLKGKGRSFISRPLFLFFCP